MTTPDTKAIRENMKALDGFTAGPWSANVPREVRIVGRIHRVLNPENYPAAFVPAWDQPEAGEDDGKDEAIANARLIAAALDMRKTILALCAEVERLRAECGRIGRDLNMAKYGKPDFAWSIHLEVMADLRAECERLREALTFYTVPGNWCIGGPLDGNSGNYTGGPARAALAQKGGEA